LLICGEGRSPSRISFLNGHRFFYEPVLFGGLIMRNLIAILVLAAFAAFSTSCATEVERKVDKDSIRKRADDSQKSNTGNPKGE
jgi:hypothetical protein